MTDKNINKNNMLNDSALENVNGGAGTITFEYKYELRARVRVKNTFDPRPGTPSEYDATVVGYRLNVENGAVIVLYNITVWLMFADSPELFYVPESDIIGTV